MTIAEARALFAPAGCYLNTATYGLPARPVLERLARVLDEWRQGTGVWEEWSRSTDAAREAFSRLVDVPARDVAVGATVSELAGLVIASLPDGAAVLVAEGEFTSIVYPCLAHAGRGV